MTNGLHIAPGFHLPHEAVTETFAIVGKRGSGKTSTGVVLVEEMVTARLPVAVIDPVGVWYGLRLSKDGKGPGLDVIIIGGEHGDVPLEEASGAVLADFLIESGRPCVFDLSGLRKGAQVRFMTDFAERLYQAKATRRDALHLVVDEADAFAPQRPQANEARLLGAMEDLVRRGRSRGLGLTLITQRPAVLNKNVLTQTECLVVMRMPAPQDRAAVDAWIGSNGTTEKRDAMMKSLASLEKGEAWFWSAAWLDVFKKVQVRARTTFDSSRTPKAGERATRLAALAPVDLGQLRERIAATIEKAKAEDPKALRARVAELEAQLRERPEREPVRVEVPVLGDAELRRLEAVSAVVQQALGELSDVVQEIGTAVDRARGASGTGVNGVDFHLPTAPSPLPVPAPVYGTLPKDVRVNVPARRAGPGAPTNGEKKLSACARAILQVLAQRAGSWTTKSQAAILSEYSVTSSTFSNALSELRVAGLLEGGGTMGLRATPAGRAAAGPVKPMPKGRELLEHWQANLGACERALLGAIFSERGRHVRKAILARDTGYSETSSTFSNGLSKLRVLELITRDAEPRIAPVFLEAAS